MMLHLENGHKSEAEGEKPLCETERLDDCDRM